jgi:hypothetical protein
MSYDLDAKTLMIWIRASEMAVREQPAGVVAADELEFFPVAHDVRWIGGVWRCLCFGCGEAVGRRCGCMGTAVSL